MEELTFNENVGKHLSDFSRDVSERCQGPFFVISRDIKPRPGRRRLECPHRALLLHQITERPQFQGCRSANENKRSPVWRLQIILCHRFFGIFKAKKRKPLIPLKQYKNRNWKEIKFKIFYLKKKTGLILRYWALDRESNRACRKTFPKGIARESIETKAYWLLQLLC